MVLRIVRHEASQIERVFERLVRVSERAYARPPWNLRTDHAGLLAVMRGFADVWFFLAGEEGGDEVAGFSVGVRLDAPALDYFRVPRCCGVGAGDYHLAWRAVDPDHQGRGVGRALVTVRLDHAAELGCPRVLGDTQSANLPTLRLYDSLGFEVCHRRRRAGAAGGHSTVFFVKDLRTPGVEDGR